MNTWTIYVFDNDYRSLAYTEKFKGTRTEAEAYCEAQSWDGETYSLMD